MDDQTSAFYTKTFFVKFAEEEVEVNDICHFRIELDMQKATDSNLDEDSLVLEVDLMFFDFLASSKQQ